MLHYSWPTVVVGVCTAALIAVMIARYRYGWRWKMPSQLWWGLTLTSVVLVLAAAILEAQHGGSLTSYLSLFGVGLVVVMNIATRWRWNVARNVSVALLYLVLAAWLGVWVHQLKHPHGG